jgi:predicted AAA+ superfamily ATPase
MRQRRTEVGRDARHHHLAGESRIFAASRGEGLSAASLQDRLAVFKRACRNTLMALRPRGLLPLLRARLDRWPITVLTGARQTGKTTLARDLLPRAEGPEAVYFSLDVPDEPLRLAGDPVRRLDYGKRLVVLDEIQKQPALLDAVKLLADRKRGHRFLLLASSQILLLQKARATLAARVALLEVWPLALINRPSAARQRPTSQLSRRRRGYDGAVTDEVTTGSASPLVQRVSNPGYFASSPVTTRASSLA